MWSARSLNKFIAYLLALAITAGCASTTVSNREQTVSGTIPRPAQIWVYDFAATPAEVPPESSLSGQPTENAAPPTAQR